MIDKHPPTDLGPGVNLNSGNKSAQMGHQTGNERKSQMVEPMSDAVK
jgi:hypothetical protein